LPAYFRSLYFRSGEIATILALALFVIYYSGIKSGASRILESESASRSIVNEICEKEAQIHKNRGFYAGFADLVSDRGRIRSLRPVVKGKSPAGKNLSSEGRAPLEVVTDDRYYYMLGMKYPPRQAGDLSPAEKEQMPCGFRCLSWPVRYGLTGEVCYYADDSGGIAVTANPMSRLDGLETPLPKFSDFPGAAEAVFGKKDEVFQGWRRD